MRLGSKRDYEGLDWSIELIVLFLRSFERPANHSSFTMPLKKLNKIKCYRGRRP